MSAGMEQDEGKAQGSDTDPEQTGSVLDPDAVGQDGISCGKGITMKIIILRQCGWTEPIKPFGKMCPCQYRSDDERKGKDDGGKRASGEIRKQGAEGCHGNSCRQLQFDHIQDRLLVCQMQA